MLTKAQINIVKSTIPILETSGEVLTKHFYGILLKDDVARPLFNAAHQVAGTQPRALANSILCYAKNIETLENLGPLAAQIVNKHVSLQILPEHYPIVGRSLIRAIREVLGEKTATDEVLQAWAAAYQQLADVLIDAEGKVYDELAAAPGGWRGARQFRVSKKTPESSIITSFYLEPTDGKPVLSYKPGQYCALHLELPGHADSVRRNYSLSQAADGKGLRISVKREEAGTVSKHLHDNVSEGDVVNVFPPCGEFVLDVHSTKPLALISAGVGITPTMAMLQAATSKCPFSGVAVAPGGKARPVSFVHYARSPKLQAFAEAVDAIAAKNEQVKRHFIYTDTVEALEDPKGRVNAEQLKALLPSTDVDAYVLGPKGFMAATKRALLDIGVPESQIKWEFFGPAEAL